MKIASKSFIIATCITIISCTNGDITTETEKQKIHRTKKEFNKTEEKLIEAARINDLQKIKLLINSTAIRTKALNEAFFIAYIHGYIKIIEKLSDKVDHQYLEEAFIWGTALNTDIMKSLGVQKIKKETIKCGFLLAIWNENIESIKFLVNEVDEDTIAKCLIEAINDGKNIEIVKLLEQRMGLVDLKSEVIVSENRIF